jgi:hypothetical protein
MPQVPEDREVTRCPQPHETCGTCGSDEHSTKACNVTEPKQYKCVNCNVNGHASWDRDYPSSKDPQSWETTQLESEPRLEHPPPRPPQLPRLCPTETNGRHRLPDQTHPPERSNLPQYRPRTQEGQHPKRTVTNPTLHQQGRTHEQLIATQTTIARGTWIHNASERQRPKPPTQPNS